MFFARYTVNADEEEIAKCIEEKKRALSKCIPGGGGPEAGGAQPEGAVFPEGMDPSMLEIPEGAMPEGYPAGAEGEDGGMAEGGAFPSFDFDMGPIKNASIICTPGLWVTIFHFFSFL